MLFESLLSKDGYIKFLEDIARGVYPVQERDDWLSWVGGDVEKLVKILRYIGEVLYQKHYTVCYPIEMIVVPRYPFTKQPMVRWSDLKVLNSSDTEVTRLKKYASQLGNLINVGFLLRNFLLIDIDSKPEEIRKLVDVETRRGFHIIRYMPNYPALEFKYRNNSPNYKVSLNCNGIKIDIITSSNFLGSHPLQSRYLEYNGKINVRAYTFRSKEAEIAFRSADLTLLKISANDAIELIYTVLKELGCSDLCKNLEIKPVEKETVTIEVNSVKEKESRFNRAPIMLAGALSYRRFKEILYKHIEEVPVCLRYALFGNISKGHRWYHLRLLIAVVPYFVLLDSRELSQLIDDFVQRTNSTRGDARKWIYDSKYFSGKAEVNESRVIVPSRFGVPADAWTEFETLGYCRECFLRNECLKLSGSERRRLIVRTISVILERELEAMGL